MTSIAGQFPELRSDRPRARLIMARYAIGPILLATLFLALAGCEVTPYVVPANQQTAIDRQFVEYPAGFVLKPYLRGLTAPTAICFDADGSLIVVNNGLSGMEPHIFGIHRDGSQFEIYPYGRPLPIIKTGFEMYGPVGGIVALHGRIYVSHRDAEDRGVITALGYDGSHTTIAADLPAEGDYGVTDMAVDEHDRLYFGVGTATNSGVIGLDNWSWIKRHRSFSDSPAVDLKLTGYRGDAPNPEFSPLLGVGDLIVNGPFQPWGVSNLTRIARNDSPTGAIYSVAVTGGDRRVEAWGLHNPRGLAFDEYGQLYFTDDGMELRGIRPIADDPDVLYRLVPGRGKDIPWYGWPDYGRNLKPISDPQFQPPLGMIIGSGYREVGPLIDHIASGLVPPDPLALLKGEFRPQSGAARMDFVPGAGPFREFRGSVIVALSGDHAPFSTGGLGLKQLTGYKVVQVDPDRGAITDFVFNTRRIPASMLPGMSIFNLKPPALERPIDVKFGPDGALYILDMGRMQDRDGEAHIDPGSGGLFRLVPLQH